MDLDQPGTTLRSVVVSGMGGLGKTEIAREYTFSRQTKFDVICWINADTREKLNFGFFEMSRALGLEDEASLGNDVVSRRLSKAGCPNLFTSHTKHPHMRKRHGSSFWTTRTIWTLSAMTSGHTPVPDASL